MSESCLPAGRGLIYNYIIMFYVYILQSITDNGIYIGKTNNLKRRLYEHNSGVVQSTRHRRPFKILEYTILNSEIEAIILEKEYKKGYKREEVKRKYNLI